MLLYTFRNLFKVPMRTLQLVLGSFLVIILIFCALAFQAGMDISLQADEDLRNVILLGIGSEESIERSEISLATVSAVSSIYGLKKQFDSVAVSPEVHFNTLIEIDHCETEAFFRGVTPVSLSVYNQVILNGKFPKSGQIMVGVAAWKRLGVSKEKLKIGSKIIFEKQEFTISSLFYAPNSIMESEIWINLGDLVALTRRDSLSCIVVRLDTAEFADIDLFCKQRLDLQIIAITENSYYNKLKEFFQPIKLMTWLTALLIASGAFFGGINTFYAAIILRKSEFAILEVIGYSRLILFFSLFIESIFFHMIAYLLAAIIAINYFSTIYLSFSSNFFHLFVGNNELVIVLCISIVLALFVIILPAISLFKNNLVGSLRD